MLVVESRDYFVRFITDYALAEDKVILSQAKLAPRHCERELRNELRTQFMHLLLLLLYFVHTSYLMAKCRRLPVSGI